MLGGRLTRDCRPSPTLAPVRGGCIVAGMKALLLVPAVVFLVLLVLVVEESFMRVE